MRVLLVEDNAPLREALAKRLRSDGFAVDEKSLPKYLKPTHRSLFDGSLQGIERTDCPAIGFQGHPEASPGPHDLRSLFYRFVQMMKEYKKECSG